MGQPIVDGVADGISQQRATQNAVECDVIENYSPTFDKIAIACIASVANLTLAQVAGDVLISSSTFTNGATGQIHSIP